MINFWVQTICRVKLGTDSLLTFTSCLTAIEVNLLFIDITACNKKEYNQLELLVISGNIQSADAVSVQ